MWGLQQHKTTLLLSIYYCTNAYSPAALKRLPKDACNLRELGSQELHCAFRKSEVYTIQIVQEPVKIGEKHNTMIILLNMDL